MRWLILILLFVGCKKIDDNGFREYRIKKGNHRSTYQIRRDCDSILKYQVIFDNSAIYTTSDPGNQADVNKLFGCSDCGNGHMQNSIRVGWRWYNDSLELLWFKHELGQFSFDKIKSIELDQIIECQILLSEYEYQICIDGECRTTSRICNGVYKHYRLFPYFGGDEAAPHDIKILLKEI